MTELPRGARATVGAALIVVLVAGATVVIKGAYGALSNQYPLSGMFVRAGEGLHNDSQVQYRGVTVGKVASIELANGRARVGMDIDSGFRVPVDAEAVISPKNVFGEEIVDLRFPPGDAGPSLPSGGTIRHTDVSDELTQFLAAADALLNQINGRDLATVISELSVASAGEGPEMAAGIDEGEKLAGLFNETLTAQIQALNSFTRFSEALAPTGPSLNAIAANNNLALPRFNAEAAAYAKVLDSFGAASDELARLLSDYHPDLAAIMTQGDNVMKVLIARQQNVSDVIHGLARYTFKFAKGGSSPETLPDGTKFAYFKTFILFSDINTLVCNLVAPPQPGMGFLQPLQQALTGAGSPFNCSAQMAAFARAQATGAAVGSPTAGAAAAAQHLSNAVGSIIGTPEAPAATGGASQIIGQLLGGSP